MLGMPTITMPALPKFGASAESSKVFKLAAPVVALVIAGAVLLFVVWPTISRVISITVTNRQLTERVGSLEEKAAVLQDLDRSLLDRQLTASEQVLPSDKGVFSIISQIERQASASGVILNKITVAPGSIGGTTESEKLTATGQPPAAQTAGQSADLGGVTVATPYVQIKVSFSGDYRGFLNFLNALTGLPRIVSVHDLTIISSGADGSSVIDVQMTVDAYWKGLPTELPPVESPIEKLTDEEVALLEDVRFEDTPSAPVTVGGGSVGGPIGRSDIFAPF